MEYVPGGSLADKVRVSRPTSRQAAGLIATVAEAVGYAHSCGVIHRDLKPSNILLDVDGQPKVADFGLARDVAGEHGSYCLTRTGMIAGTPAYMPPEQLEGTKKLTPAVDVWALGVMLYEFITGAVPIPWHQCRTDLRQSFGARADSATRVAVHCAARSGNHLLEMPAEGTAKAGTPRGRN